MGRILFLSGLIILAAALMLVFGLSAGSVTAGAPPGLPATSAARTSGASTEAKLPPAALASMSPAAVQRPTDTDTPTDSPTNTPTNTSTITNTPTPPPCVYAWTNQAGYPIAIMDEGMTSLNGKVYSFGGV